MFASSLCSGLNTESMSRANTNVITEPFCLEALLAGVPCHRDERGVATDKVATRWYWETSFCQTSVRGMGQERERASKELELAGAETDRHQGGSVLSRVMSHDAP